MDPNTFLIASLQIASHDPAAPWDVAGKPLVFENKHLQKKNHGSPSHCPHCGNEIKGYAAKEEARQHLNSLLEEGYLLASVPAALSPGEEVGDHDPGTSRSKPGTDHNLLPDALSVARLLRMPAQEALATLWVEGARLGRRIEYDLIRRVFSGRPGASSFVSDGRPASKGKERLNHASGCLLDVTGENDNLTGISAEDLQVERKGGMLGPQYLDLSKAFFLTIVGALLKEAASLDHFQVNKHKNGAPGKVSAQEGMLCQSLGRAPPKGDSLGPGAVWHLGKRLVILRHRTTSPQCWPPMTLTNNQP
jgi:hypothetical protein